MLVSAVASETVRRDYRDRVPGRGEATDTFAIGRGSCAAKALLTLLGLADIVIFGELDPFCTLCSSFILRPPQAASGRFLHSSAFQPRTHHFASGQKGRFPVQKGPFGFFGHLALHSRHLPLHIHHFGTCGANSHFDKILNTHARDQGV